MQTIPLNKGIYRSPSAGADGELDMAVNLMPHDGELMNTPRLNDSDVTLPLGSIFLTRHSVQEGDHWLYVNNEEIKPSTPVTPTIRTVRVSFRFDEDEQHWEWNIDYALNEGKSVTVEFYGTYTSRIRLALTNEHLLKEFSVRVTIDPQSGSSGIIPVPKNGVDNVQDVGDDLQIRYAEIIDTAGCYAVIADSSYSRPRKIKRREEYDPASQANALYYASANDDSTFTYTLIKILPEPIDSINILGNTLIIQSDHIYYCVWKDGEYIWLGSDFPEPLIQFRLRGEYKSIFKKNAVHLNDDYSSTEDFDFSEVVTTDDFNVTSIFGGVVIVDLQSALSTSDYYQLKIRGQDKSQYKSYVYGYNPASHEWERIGITKASKRPTIIFKPANAYTQIKFGTQGQGRYTLLKAKSIGDITFDNVNDDRGLSGFNMVMGVANEFANVYARGDNKFLYPFFVRYALRLYDGTSVSISAPCLMIPSSGTAPFVWSPRNASNNNIWDVYCDGFLATLQSKVINTGDLSPWKDIITGIDIAVTPPIYSYNQGAKFNPDDIPVKLKEKYLTYINDNDGSYVYKLDIEDESDFYGYGETDSNTTFNGIMSMSWMYSYKNPNSPSGAKIIQYVLPRFDKTQVCNHIAETSSFHIIKNIKVEDFATTQDFEDISLDEDTLSSLEARRILGQPDEVSRYLTAATAKVYNRRLVMADVYKLVSPGSYPSLMNGVVGMFIYDMDEGGYNENFKIIACEVQYNENGQKHTLARVEPNGVFSQNYHFCFAYYPDSKADSMTLYAVNNSKYYYAELPLTPYKSMNASFYFQGYEGVDWQELQGVEVTEGGTTTTIYPIPSTDQSAEIHYPNLLVQSKANNPFVFPLNLQNWIGNKPIMALCANTRALSQGQFGQHPMYAFTEEGIWSLSVGNNGEFSAVQPVSRDVCNNTGSICQTDNDIIFSTTQGLKILTGSSATLLIPQFDGISASYDDPDGNSLLGDGSIADGITSLTIADILTNATLSYDYINNLLHIYPVQDIVGQQDKQYASHHLAVSLPDRQVCFVNDGIRPVNIVPDYPADIISYQEDSQVCLASYGKPEDFDVARSGLILTRPLAFGNPLEMKMLDDLRIIWRKYRSQDTSNTPVTINATIKVLASNDRLQWHLLPSLRQHSFKWYRFAVYTSFTDAERLTALAIEETTRRNNKIR